jgi:isopentenyl phosphate kinase
MPNLIFLKLGGSLITDKNQPRTPRREVLARIGSEIASARAAQPGLPLLIGHGSGSFGHTAAKKHGTRQGVRTAEEWLGFAEVWKEARALNQIVVAALQDAGLPVIAFPPSASVIARDGRPRLWDLAPIQAAISAGLVPMINGDTIFDEQRGGTILSTEDLFFYLARQLHPRRILLAGLEAGVWADFPACTQLIHTITPEDFPLLATKIGGSASVDVTGGMLEKVKSMLSLVQEEHGLEVMIFSGLLPGGIRDSLLGAAPGTQVNAGEPIWNIKSR